MTRNILKEYVHIQAKDARSGYAVSAVLNGEKDDG